MAVNQYAPRVRDGYRGSEFDWRTRTPAIPHLFWSSFRGNQWRPRDHHRSGVRMSMKNALVGNESTFHETLLLVFHAKTAVVL